MARTSKNIDDRTLPPTRQAGVCLHMTSLPGPYGIGELGAHALGFIDRMVDMELGVWQFLPTGPTAFGDSPYQPLSTFAGNEMLVDIGDLIRIGLLEDKECGELTVLPVGYVDFGRLIPIKSRLLRIAASRFADHASQDMKTAFDLFLGNNDAGWLHDYALFRILKARHSDRPWPQWAPEYVHREDSALGELKGSAATEIESIKIIQFLFHDQWNRLRSHAHRNGVRLLGDLSIYIALDSADAWANPQLLRVNEDGQPDKVAGVPADYFSQVGQLWGNPLYAWEHHETTGYAWWIARLKAATELADIVRIDHFRGFEAYWAVPADSPTAEIGAWETGPGNAIFDAIHRTLGNLPIVVEDLGFITAEVEALRDRYNFPGMHVLQFDVAEKNFSLDRVGENSVCYTATHDNDTTIGWFQAGPDGLRSIDDIRQAQDAVLALTGGESDTVHADLIGLAFSTRARLAIAPMQDYLGLGSEARLNTPGQSGNNWRWRVLDTQLTAELCDNVAGMVCESGRGRKYD